MTAAVVYKDVLTGVTKTAKLPTILSHTSILGHLAADMPPHIRGTTVH